MSIFSIILFGATSLVTPNISSISDYHFITIPTNDVIVQAWGSGDGVDVTTQFPKYSNYDSFAIMGKNGALKHCVKGLAFTDYTARIENLFWLSEAFAERYCLTYNFRPLSGIGVFGLSFKNRQVFSNPISSQTPIFIKRSPPFAGEYRAYMTDVNGEYVEYPSFDYDFLIGIFGGDGSNPAEGWFSKYGEIKPNTPVDFSAIRHSFEFLTEFKNGISPRIGGSCEESTIARTYSRKSITKKSVSYDKSTNQPVITSTTSEGTNETTLIESSGISMSFSSFVTLRNFSYMSDWDEREERYKSVTGSGVSDYVNETTSETPRNYVVYLDTLSESEDGVDAGGFNRLGVNEDCFVIHHFVCTYSVDQEAELKYGEPEETDLSYTASVFYLENYSESPVLGSTLPDRIGISNIDDNRYYIKLNPNMVNMMMGAYEAAFKEYPFVDTFGSVSDPPSPVHADYGNASASKIKYGGDMSTFSTKIAYQSVVYSGIWAGGKYLRFRTVPNEQE